MQSGQVGCEGTVIKIEICYTTLLSIDNKHVMIPNGTLSNSIITNVTARDQRKLEIKVGISYQSDMHKAKEILERLLKEDPDTKEDEGYGSVCRQPWRQLCCYGISCMGSY